jgi:uncharacterized membrane protein
MDLFAVLWTLYALIALLALALTVRERMRERLTAPATAVLGVLACIFWPVAATGLWVAARSDIRRNGVQ